jgi:four helix bundle suffix protein
MSFPKYKYLITYRLSEIIFDLVDQFILSYLSNLGNLSYLSLKDQILKATRSIKQNIIEAVSEVASLKSQIKLLGVAYGSVEELIADFEDFLRRKNLEIYPQNHPKIASFRRLGKNLSHLSNLSPLGDLRKKPTLPTSSQDAANLILTLSHQLSFLLYRQIKSMEAKFIEEGGYTENLFLKRLKRIKKPKPPKSPKGFTLMELLLVIALIALLATALLILFNPKKQIEKAQDSKRKTEITQLQKVLEDWYNDKNCYPKPEEICYDSPTSNNTCHICGHHPSSPKFTPYLSSLPCDPQYPRKNYLYYFDDSACPKSYVIYTSLSNTTDPAIAQVNCQNGCGPDDDCHFNYGFSSPNTSPHTCQSNQPTIPPTNTPYPTNQSNFYCRDYSSLYILDNKNICNICGNYNQCLQSYPNNQFFIDSNCQTTCIKN